MLFFNPRRVAEGLRDNAFTAPVLYRFMMLSALLQSIEALLRSFYSVGSPAYRLLASAFGIVVALTGLYFINRTNARGDNRSLIERFLCLSVPIYMWTRVLPNILQAVLFYVLLSHYGRAANSLYAHLSPFFSIGQAFLLVLAYALVNYYIRIAASGPLSPDRSSSMSPEFISAPIAAP